MDMGIVNAGELVVYDEIEPELRELCRRCGTEPPPRRYRAISGIRRNCKKQRSKEVKEIAWREHAVEERLKHALVNGITDYIDADTEEARQKYPKPLE